FLLMAPMPDGIREKVVTFLQIGSAEVTAWFFSIGHIPFTREGVVLALPTVTIEVARECSVIRSSLILFLTSLVMAHLFLNSGWSKLALMISVIPLTIAKNGFRIFALSTLGMYVDRSFLTGALHSRGGIVFFALFFVALWAIVWVLQRIEDKVDPGNKKK